MIEIIGEVNSPGFYQYVKNYKLKDYLKFSGGLNAKASNIIPTSFIQMANLSQ